MAPTAPYGATAVGGGGGVGLHGGATGTGSATAGATTTTATVTTAAAGAPSSSTTTATAKAPRRASGKQGHSRSYPRGVGLDFRKLAGLTLLQYIDHHGTYNPCQIDRVLCRAATRKGRCGFFFLLLLLHFSGLSPHPRGRPPFFQLGKTKRNKNRSPRPPRRSPVRAGGGRGQALRADGR